MHWKDERDTYRRWSATMPICKHCYGYSGVEYDSGLYSWENFKRRHRQVIICSYCKKMGYEVSF